MFNHHRKLLLFPDSPSVEDEKSAKSDNETRINKNSPNTVATDKNEIKRKASTAEKDDKKQLKMRAYLNRVRPGGRSVPSRLPPLSVSVPSSPQFSHFYVDKDGDNDDNNSDETFHTRTSDYSINKNFRPNIHHRSRNQIEHTKNHDKKILESSQRILKEFSPNIVEFSGDTFSSSNYDPRSQMMRKNVLNHKTALSKANNSSIEITKTYEKSYLSNRPLYLDFHGNYGSDGEVIPGRNEYNNGKTREERKYYGSTSPDSMNSCSPSLSGTVYNTLKLYFSHLHLFNDNSSYSLF
jgi:hypothetical protein